MKPYKSRTKVRSAFGLLLLALACVLALACAARVNQPVNRNAQILENFRKSVEEYVELRHQIEGQLPSLKDKTDPSQIVAHQKTLAEKIRAARAEARQGDLFTRDVTKLLRAIITRELKGPGGTRARAAIIEENPQLKLQVNAEYPETQPLSIVPPELLMKLPRLPEDVEYRFGAAAMILRDVRSNLILDFIPRVL